MMAFTNRPPKTNNTDKSSDSFCIYCYYRQDETTSIAYDAHFLDKKKTQKATCKQNAVRRQKGMELSVHKEESAPDPSLCPFPDPSCPPEGESWPCLPAYVRESGSASSPGFCSSCASLGRGRGLDPDHHGRGHGHDHHGPCHGHDPGLGLDHGLGPCRRYGRPFLGGGADCVSGRGCGAEESVCRSAKPRTADSWPTIIIIARQLHAHKTH